MTESHFTHALFSRTLFVGLASRFPPRGTYLMVSYTSEARVPHECMHGYLIEFDNNVCSIAIFLAIGINILIDILTPLVGSDV